MSPVQVISIATLASPTGMGGFFPDGLNGPINGAPCPTSCADGSHARNTFFLTLTLNRCSDLMFTPTPTC